MLLIFTLGRPDVLPVDDFGVRDGYRHLYGLEVQPKPKALAEIGAGVGAASFDRGVVSVARFGGGAKGEACRRRGHSVEPMIAAGDRTSVTSTSAARCYAIPLPLPIAAACRLRERFQLLPVLFARTGTTVRSTATSLWRAASAARLCELRHARPAKTVRALRRRREIQLIRRRTAETQALEMPGQQHGRADLPIDVAL